MDLGLKGEKAIISGSTRGIGRAVPDHCGDRGFCDPGISHAISAVPGAVLAGYLATA